MTYIDCPVSISNLGLSKINGFGQAQPLRRKKKEKNDKDRRNIFR